MNKELLLSNTVSVANVTALIKETIKKVGLEYVAPLDEAIQNEEINKAVLNQIHSTEPHN